MQDLSPRQQDALTAIREHILEHGRPPTMRQLGAVMGISSTNGVSDHLRRLERKGYIRRDKNQACGIHVVGSEAPVLPRKATAREHARACLDGLQSLNLSPTARAILRALRLEIDGTPGTLGASDTGHDG